MAARRKAAKKRKLSKGVPAGKGGEHSLEEGMVNFAEEVQRLGERFEKGIDEKGDGLENWFHSTFGVVGPFLSSVFGLVLLALFIWVLSIVNIPVGSGLLSNVHYFLLAHTGWFFLIFLFFSYTSYVSKRCHRVYFIFSPLLSGAAITIGIWVVSSVVRVANISLGIQVLSAFSSFLDSSLLAFFFLFSFLGYLYMLLSLLTGRTKLPGHVSARGAAGKPPKTVAPRRAATTGRLYRSGRERILGGVCGGIAEYIGVDPVLVRLLWVVASLAWGSGILLYIILWIIMPRNPRDKWD